MKTIRNQGFTLLELLVAIIIIALLAVALISSEPRTHERANRTTCASQMGQIHKAITMYEVDYSSFPTLAEGDASYTKNPQDALNLLYRQYIDDVRVFSCPKNKMTGAQLSAVAVSSAPGYAGSLVSSYGYSPGHDSENSRVIILADKKGVGVNSDNHGKNAGQNELSSGGSVNFIPALPNNATPTNDLGKKRISIPLLIPTSSLGTAPRSTKIGTAAVGNRYSFKVFNASRSQVMERMKNAGLTLTEVIIVIVIVAILGVSLIPANSHHREPARRTACGQQMGQIHKAITMYEVDYSSYPAIGAGQLAYTEKPQDALNLLYRQYIDDPRVFSCPSNKMSSAQLNSVKDGSVSGYAGSLTSSYGYSPGHNSTNARVIVLADKKGTGANSDNHGKNVGQNELSSDGTVRWIPALPNGATPINNLGAGKDGKLVIDPDIYTFGDLPGFPDWDSGCQ